MHPAGQPELLPCDHIEFLIRIFENVHPEHEREKWLQRKGSADLSYRCE